MRQESCDQRHAEREERQREILTLRHRFEALEPYEAEAKAIRKRLRELESS